jgi:hypothetical protein
MPEAIGKLPVKRAEWDGNVIGTGVNACLKRAAERARPSMFGVWISR